MTLNRQTLAKIDKRILSQMDHDDGVQLVKVPVSEAVWSTWRRYCEAAGVNMGRGLAVMIHQELAAFVGEDLAGLAERLKDRESKIVALGAELARRAEALDRTERTLVARERQLAAEPDKVSRSSQPRTPPKLGRNEPCWCGSGKKFKYCHALS
jgi:preprotein translocase subunit SecA